MKANKPIKGNGNVNRFYNWLVMCGNVHLNNHESVVNAFRIVALHQPNQNVRSNGPR